MNKKQTVNNILVLTAITLSIGFIYPAQAEVFKWKDSKGVMQYSDTPPSTSMKKISKNINNTLPKDLVAQPITDNISNQNETQQSFMSNIFNKNTNTVKTTTSKQLANTTTTTTKFKRQSSTGAISTKTASQLTTNQTKTNSTSLLTNGVNFKNLTVLGGINKNKPKTVIVSPTPIVTPTPVIIPTPIPVVTPTPVIMPAEPVVIPQPTPITPTEPIVSPTPPTTPPISDIGNIPLPEVNITPTPIIIPTPIADPTPIPTPIINTNLIQVGMQPTVDISKNMISAIGSALPQVQPTTIIPAPGSSFRVVCKPSHMSNDDPLVYPNQQGAAHHHIFFGNTSIDYKSNLSIINSVGNSTCGGGILNRSAYWTPSLIDTETNAPLVPDFSIFYYKKNVDAVLVAPPKGLKMISGNSKAVTASEGQGKFVCYNSRVWNGWKNSMSNCEAGDILFMTQEFPSCWDGKNLDSPNHKDHMAFPSNAQCPITHPVAIPIITMNLEYAIKTTGQNAKWRLASDNYSADLPGGYSMHADWVNGWDETIMKGIVDNCINAGKDAQAHLLCDGRILF